MGHRRRRDEAYPLLVEKFRANIATRLDETKVERLVELFGDRGRHARSAVGLATLPNGMAVEVEAIVEVRD